MFEIIFVLFCYIILFVSIFYLTTTNYSTLVKAPFYVILILLFTYVSYVVAGYWSNTPGTEPTEKKQIFEIFKRFSYIYGEYILIILGVFILFLVFYKLFMGLLVFSLTKSLWITFGLIILVLALVKNSFYESEPDSKAVAFIKDIIFYIPCLITDSIEFMKKDYSETPTTTFVVFILIIIYCCIFFLVPLINTDGGILIVSGPQPLDMITTITTNEIVTSEFGSYTKEANKDFSYNVITYTVPPSVKSYPRDKVTQDLEPFTNEVDINDMINDISNNARNDISNNLIRNKPTIESFIGLVQTDTTYNMGFGNSYHDTSDNENIHEFEVKEVYQEISNTTGTFFSKMYTGYRSFMDLFTTNDIASSSSNPYKYNYALSFWLYIDTKHFKKNGHNQQIIQFGDKLNLVYDNIENDLVLLLEKNEIYRSKAILYQKWNHVVINVGKKVDLFINNNLVGTYKYKKASVVDLYDSLIIGSIKNNNFGSVCNFRYYNNVLDLSKIKSIYTKYNKKNPPI